MKDEPLDSRHEALVAALYGEPGAPSPAELEALLAQDPALRLEWEELSEARALLEWPADAETGPGFVFLEPPRPTRGAAGSGFLGRFVPRGLTPAWGFAGAALALAVLIVAGFRVDRVERGLAVRFGPAPSVEAPGGTFPVDRARPTLEASTDDRGLRLEPASQTAAADGREAVTRNELNAYSAAVLEAMAGALSESQIRQKREMAFILERFYDSLIDEQNRKYEDLRTRVEGVGLGLLAEQTRTNARLSRLIDADRAEPGDPGANSTTPEAPHEETKP